MREQQTSIPWLDEDTPLPSPETAQSGESALRGLVAAGGGLSVSRLVEAYSNGMFPWFSAGQPILWWSTDPRMVLQVRDFKLHRSLKKTLQKFMANPAAELRFDHDFSQVIQHCAAASREGQSGTWIVPDMIEAYTALHHAGHAHSIETWLDGELIGGLYCVSIGRAVFGESMFALRTDASKIALAGLVAWAKARHIEWIDCQQNTRHLASLGAREMNRSDFLKNVHRDRTAPAPDWEFDPTDWAQLLPAKGLT